MARKGVLIVDDHAVVREGLRAIVTADGLLTVVGDAANGEDACAQAAALKPDVVLMDLSMPGLNGSDATRRLREVSPESRVVVLTAHEEAAYVRHALDAGARGYVLKRAVLEDLRRAIHIVLAGGIFLDPQLASRSVRATPAVSEALTADLSIREIEIASLAAQGHSNAEIAADLTLSVKTVEAHKTRVMTKLGLRTRAQLVTYALYRGWLSA